MNYILYKGLNAQVMENDLLRVILLPQYGCKLASLVSKQSGREFLFQSASEKLKIPPYAAPFCEYDASGFDEVFPSLDACPYPEGPFQGLSIPDHGELWTLPWKSAFSPLGNSVKSIVQSQQFPYLFSRTVTLQENELLFEYSVENLSDFEFKFIWMPHCLLACSPATQLLVPDNLTQIINVEHNSQHLGPWGTRHNYPITTDAHGNVIDLSLIEPSSAHNCEKFYFTAPNVDGWCGIEHTDTHEQLIYTYPSEKIPYLGIWKSQGGYRGDYNLALEPCSSMYDDLYVASKIHKASCIAPHKIYEWTLTLTIR